MLGGRASLPVLAEVVGSPQGTRAWSLTAHDLQALGGVLPRLAEHRVTAIAGEGEEPAIVAIALASAAAASGRRAILVECDLAHPRLAAHVGLAPSQGLHEYLRWEAESADVLQPIALAGPASAASGGQLVCVCGGRPAAETEALLGLQSFSHAIEKLRAGYELVLLLAPPVRGEPGAAEAVARQADAVLAGLSADQAGGRSGRAVRVAVNRLPAKALGAISVAAAP